MVDPKYNGNKQLAATKRAVKIAKKGNSADQEKRQLEATIRCVQQGHVASKNSVKSIHFSQKELKEVTDYFYNTRNDPSNYELFE
ncbi:hypothetical protein [Arsenophonus nasoniae]|uniref:Uncharacterized protein n=1 Tax=Arsenophonus nasoniae TaxID=638 RepID=A0AA95K238_9GAMM|nr:hypothetical protein [Arsenophonus nasoniae]WGL96496.1 hypothetical protein QE207_08140 [Arsenophonus nasoniae]